MLIVLFFLINLLFITYIVDADQVIIPDPSNFSYPVWLQTKLRGVFRLFKPLVGTHGEVLM